MPEKITIEEANKSIFDQAKSDLLRQGKTLKFMIDQVEKGKTDQYGAISDIAYDIIRYSNTMCAFRDADFLKGI